VSIPPLNSVNQSTSHISHSLLGPPPSNSVQSNPLNSASRNTPRLSPSTSNKSPPPQLSLSPSNISPTTQLSPSYSNTSLSPQLPPLCLATTDNIASIRTLSSTKPNMMTTEDTCHIAHQPTHPMTTRSQANIFKPKPMFLGIIKYPLPKALLAAQTHGLHVPTCYIEASKSPEWRIAMNQEFTALLRMALGLSFHQNLIQMLWDVSGFFVSNEKPMAPLKGTKHA
jgi:hypothetical protein